MPDVNNMHKFKDILRIFTTVDSAQTDGQTDRITKCMNIFSTLLESLKNHGTQFKLRFQRFRSTAHKISGIF